MGGNPTGLVTQQNLKIERKPELPWVSPIDPQRIGRLFTKPGGKSCLRRRILIRFGPVRNAEEYIRFTNPLFICGPDVLGKTTKGSE